jgi:hypothetical protein
VFGPGIIVMLADCAAVMVLGVYVGVPVISGL